MQFGPTNAPPFYMAMMKYFKDEWDKLFVIRILALKLHESKVVSQTTAQEIQIDGKSLAYGSKTIIDDILLWCDDKTLILLYFRCVCEVFLKYRVSLRLDKCDFLKLSVEYIGRDILRIDNFQI